MSDHAYDLTAYPADSDLLAQVLHKRVLADATLGGLTLIGVTKVVEPDDTGEVLYQFAETLDGAQTAALDALVAGHVDETLAEAQARCIADVKAWCVRKFNEPAETHGILVEYPAASGKQWSVTQEDQVQWDALASAASALSHPFSLRTWDEQDTHELADAAATVAMVDAIRVAVFSEYQARDAAVGNVVAAADIAAAETARDAYVGS
jgi:hypothetical protein